MNIKSFVVLSVLFSLIIIGCFLCLKFQSIDNSGKVLDRIVILFFDKNNYQLTSSDNIDVNKIKIIWKDEFGLSEKIIFANGEFIRGINYEYGKNVFFVYYNDSLIGVSGHFKGKNWYSNNYKFVVEDLNNKMRMNFEVRGPEGIRSDYPISSSASKYMMVECINSSNLLRTY